MAFKRFKMPPNPIFARFRIFTWLGWAHLVVSETFRTPKTAKRGQNGPHVGLKRLSKGLSAACKYWQSACMHFASLFQQRFFFPSAGWAGGFPAHVLATACLCSIVVARQNPLVYGV